MRRVAGSAGNALVEVVLLVLVTFVPLVMLLTTLARVHEAALGVTAAAREAGTAAASGTDIGIARSSATASVAGAVQDHGMHTGEMRMSVSSSTRFERGASVHVRVSYPVRVLDIPFVADAVGPAVWVRASHTAFVDPYRSAP